MYWLHLSGVMIINSMIPRRLALSVRSYSWNKDIPKSGLVSLYDVRNKASSLNKYVSALNRLCPAPLGEVVKEANTICYGLNVTTTTDCLSRLKPTDKGITGKYVEAAIFGLKPNTKSSVDLPCGFDIKTTHFIERRGLYYAKERLTITNCGTKNNYASFKNISDNETLTDCGYYTKMQKGVVFVFLYEPHKHTPESLKNKMLLCAFIYDLEKLPEQDALILKSDYAVIRRCIQDKMVTQRNQQYLHIHKHGTKKNPNSCALGFTSRFVSKLVTTFTGEPGFQQYPPGNPGKL